MTGSVWIPVIVMGANTAVPWTVIVQEFTSRARCEAARDQLDKAATAVVPVRVRLRGE